MFILRQIALAVVLVAGTALAVTAYLETQHGTLHADEEVGAPILEFGSSYPMARPLRATNRAVARESRALEAGTANPRVRREASAGGVSSLEDIKPIPASFVDEETADCLAPSAAQQPLTQ